MNNYSTKFLLFSLPLFAKLGFFCLFITPALSYSQESVLVVTSSQGGIYQDFYATLKNESNKKNSLSQVNFSDVDNKILDNHKLIVSIGYKAAKAISKYETQNTVIHSLIPDNESSHNNIPCMNNNCYKVYINQPTNRYIKLFKKLFPTGKKLVLATINTNSKISKQVKSISEKNNIPYKEIYIQKDSNISRIFTSKLNNSDVLLALPNPEIYNANNAKSIILSSYHANVPIIAYSKSFTKAGALISLYSSIDDIAEKTANIINSIIIDGPQRQKEYYPDNFTIEINSAVARSLNIEIDTKSAIKRKIK